MPTNTPQSPIEGGLKPEWFVVLPAVLITLTTIAVSLRFFVRAVMLRAWGADDWTLLAAYTLFLADASIYIKIATLELQDGGMGVIFNILELIDYTVAAELIYLATQIFSKLALALLFLRIVQEGWQRWLIGISVTIYCLFTFAFWFVALFSCGHPLNWNYLSLHCLDWDTTFGPLNYIAACLNCVIDWILTVTPVFVIVRLDIPRREKASVIALMLLGLLGSVVSVIRIPYVNSLRLDDQVTYFSRVIPIGLCSITESGIAIICLGLAALRPLYARCLQGTRTLLSSNHSFRKPSMTRDTYDGHSYRTGRTSRSRATSEVSRPVQYVGHKLSFDAPRVPNKDTEKGLNLILPD